MEKSPVITFEHMETEPRVEEEIRERIEKLERIFDRVIGCRVAVRAPHHHGEVGRVYDCHIQVEVPGQDIYVGGEREMSHAHGDAMAAVQDAFDAAERQLREHADKLRGKVKRHEPPPHGVVVKLVPRDEPWEDESYGFLESPQGHEVYFHHNAVRDDAYDQLEVGTKVRFGEEQGEKGPQATYVEIAG